MFLILVFAVIFTSHTTRTQRYKRSRNPFRKCYWIPKESTPHLEVEEEIDCESQIPYNYASGEIKEQEESDGEILKLPEPNVEHKEFFPSVEPDHPSKPEMNCMPKTPPVCEWEEFEESLGIEQLSTHENQDNEQILKSPEPHVKHKEFFPSVRGLDMTFIPKTPPPREWAEIEELLGSEFSTPERHNYTLPKYNSPPPLQSVPPPCESPDPFGDYNDFLSTVKQERVDSPEPYGFHKDFFPTVEAKAPNYNPFFPSPQAFQSNLQNSTQVHQESAPEFRPMHTAAMGPTFISWQNASSCSILETNRPREIFHRLKEQVRQAERTYAHYMKNLHPYVLRNLREESMPYIDFKFQVLERFKKAIKAFRQYLVEYDQSWRMNTRQPLDESKITQFNAVWNETNNLVAHINSQPIFQNHNRYGWECLMFNFETIGCDQWYWNSEMPDIQQVEEAEKFYFWHINNLLPPSTVYGPALSDSFELSDKKYKILKAFNEAMSDYIKYLCKESFKQKPNWGRYAAMQIHFTRMYDLVKSFINELVPNFMNGTASRMDFERTLAQTESLKFYFARANAISA